MTVEIVEVIGRSVQGMTKPFICRGDDDETYFVKGNGATRQSQVSEWIAGNLGLALGLPIAPFKIVDVPEELLALDPDLGCGPAFGSMKQTITELNYAGIDEIPIQLQRDILAFDWWIRNGDRMLTERGGNPNLFWEPKSRELVVIDHNQAFDPAFNWYDFLEYHTFREIQHSLFDDWEMQQHYQGLFVNVLGKWQEICDSIPEEWQYADKEMTVPANVDINEIFNVLNGCQQDGFWDLT